MKITTTEDYEQIKGESLSTLVVLDFYADWCAPCRRYSPIFEKVAENSTGALFASVDCEAVPDVASELGVQGIPCTILLEQGQVKSRKAGLMTEAELRSFIDDNR